MGRNFGYISINKPSGPTSHGVINHLRRITGIKKIGHCGTLDPFASGVLICAIGREATREIGMLVGLDKKYDATLMLGLTSDTFDRTGKISEFIENVSCDVPEINRILETLEGFVGKQEQMPPMFSAKKVGGKKLYELARKGIEIERKPASIEIYSIRLKSYAWPILEIAVHCTSGTYIRTLGHEIGQKLGCGAYLEGLVRTAIGKNSIRETVTLDDLIIGDWRSKLNDLKEML